MMKNLRITLLLFLFTTIGYCQKYQGESWATIKAAGAGTLTVVYYEQPGLIYSEAGKIKGACVDIMNDFVDYVQTHYNKKITVNYAGKEPVFTQFLKVVQDTKDILGVTNVTITNERKKILKFTPPFLSNPVVLLTHKNAPSIAGASDISEKLDGYSAEVIGGSTHLKHIEKIKKDYLPGLVINYGSNGADILKKISTNPKVFTILDFTEYVDATRKNMPVKRQNINFGEADELAFVMSKQSDWDVLWNEFLTLNYRKSVKYRKIIADNLGTTFLSILR
ncbi:MAG TPA: transporter substrate-binding domain-containing protein [Cyclobacteriaceae bacterium]